MEVDCEYVMNLYINREKMKIKYKNDANYRLCKILRGKLNHCINYYNETNQIPKQKKSYGVNWLGICEHLWPFKPRVLYHIDHIIPLISFNLINLDGTPNYEEISKAFAPENHQWLKIKDNLTKNDISEENFKIKQQEYKNFIKSEYKRITEGGD